VGRDGRRERVLRLSVFAAPFLVLVYKKKPENTADRCSGASTNRILAEQLPHYSFVRLPYCMVSASNSLLISRMPSPYLQSRVDSTSSFSQSTLSEKQRAPRPTGTAFADLYRTDEAGKRDKHTLTSLNKIILRAYDHYSTYQSTTSCPSSDYGSITPVTRPQWTLAVSLGETKLLYSTH